MTLVAATLLNATWATSAKETRAVDIDWDVPITMNDGTVLRADVFRPDDGQPHPVIMTHGPYAKGLAFQEGFPSMWDNLAVHHPDALAGSSNRYANWETVDPEKWTPKGYVVVRVDSRGAGSSPGYLDIFSARETQDYYECIEWAGTQPWSTGRVGLLGISYYAVNQWQVAALRPPHLVAICPWEGASDYYREFTRHGGILNIFTRQWYPALVMSVQHGVGPDGPRSAVTGDLVAGSQRLPDDELFANRAPTVQALLDHPLLDDYYTERTADLSRIEVPVLSATNWSHHLHTRGGFEGYLGVGSEQKWLEVHGFQHWVEFYTDYGVALQERFFGHFLKQQDTGWSSQSPVALRVRHVDGTFTDRTTTAWPVPETKWTTLHLDFAHGALAERAQPDDASASFPALGEGLTFWTAPFEQTIELTGPSSAQLCISSTTDEADVFITLRVQDAEGADVTFPSAIDPHGGVGFGWLRSSLRKTDPERSTPYRPWHTLDERMPLMPDVPVNLDVEIWPTSVIVPAGYRLGATILGRDFEFAGDGPWPAAFGVTMRGNGIFVHNDENDRGSGAFAGVTTLHGDCTLLLPFLEPLSQ